MLEISVLWVGKTCLSVCNHYFSSVSYILKIDTDVQNQNQIKQPFQLDAWYFSKYNKSQNQSNNISIQASCLYLAMFPYKAK